MKLLFRFLVSALLICVVRAVSLQPGGVVARSELRAASNFVRYRGCSINICFAIDGSGSMNHSEFDMQKNFIMDMVSIISYDNNASYAAVQYGESAYPILSLTDDEQEFIWHVSSTPFQGDSRTSIAAGIEYCFFELSSAPSAVSKIVLVGDGRHNAGRDPVEWARFFKSYFGHGGSLSAVSVGINDNQYMEDIAAAGGGHAFAIDDFVELSYVIEDIIFDVCGAVSS